MTQLIEPIATRVPETETEVDPPLYEVIDGRKVELPPMGALQVWLASNLMASIAIHARQARLGRAVSEMLFDLGSIGLKRRPDAAFVSYERWPRGRPIRPGLDAWNVVPDLAVEVNSPSNTGDEIVDKIRDYFAAGVLRVWIVYPTTRQVYVYNAPDSVRIVGPAGSLDGEEILPGFRLAMTELFEDVDGNDD